MAGMTEFNEWSSDCEGRTHFEWFYYQVRGCWSAVFSEWEVDQIHRLIWRLLAIAMDRELVSTFSLVTQYLSHFLDSSIWGGLGGRKFGKGHDCSRCHPSAEHLLGFAGPDSFSKNQYIYDLAQKSQSSPQVPSKWLRGVRASLCRCGYSGTSDENTHRYGSNILPKI